MNWVDKKYINLISSQFKNFKWIGTKANCSCPICGDSSKKKFKARFYFLEHTNHYSCYCHNCNYSSAFGSFLAKQNPGLYSEYRKETFAEKMLHQKVVIQPYVGNSNPVFTHSPVNDLTFSSKNELACEYMVKRKIPKNKWNRIYYSKNYKAWVNTFIPNKYNHIDDLDERIVLPFITKEQQFFGATGRSVTEKEPRYLATSVDYESKYPKLFGMDKVNTDEKFYIVEGPIDSLFLDNALAMGTTTLNMNDNFDYTNAIFCLDNEPRNSQIVGALTHHAEHNPIVVWPSDLEEKDINEMVLNGIDVNELIKANTFTGLEAKLNLQRWKKI